MNDTSGHRTFAPAGQGIGAPVKRLDDERLLTGAGRFTDDLVLPGQAYAAVVRSPVAHGRLGDVRTAAAQAAPGVLAVVTGADLAAAGYGGLPCGLGLQSQDGTPLIKPPRPALPVDRVRYVGEAIALVVAESPTQARDAAELVEPQIEPLPAAVDLRAAAAEGAPRIHDQAPGNVCLDWRGGDAAAVEAAFRTAAHVTRLSIVNNRVVVMPLEPRAAVAEYDAGSGRYTLHTGCQGVFGMQQGLAKAILKVEPGKVRVLTGDVGGSFGMKAPPYPEYVALLHAARQLGRPVRWCDERVESFLSDQHGRGSLYDCALALDKEGNFLAVRVDGLGDMGAYLASVGPMVPSANIHKNLPTLYRTPAIDVRVRCVFTNTTPVSAYRGAGRPEANYIMERLVDAAARQHGFDRIELRRRNLLRPGDLPYAAPSGQVYDSGDFAAVLDKALGLHDMAGFAARRRAARAAGRRRGLGIACYLEVTAGSGKEHGGIRFDADGGVTIVTGTLNYGQGHATAFAQVLSDRLGIPLRDIRLQQGDSDQLAAGGGTGGSRSAMASGGAILQAAEQVMENGRRLAAHWLECAIEDVEIAGTDFVVAGTDRRLSLKQVAARTRQGADLPEELRHGLEATVIHDVSPSAFPNGVHICEVEVEPETGAATVDRYTAVDDFGTLINPMLVEGQVHGGIAQGLGQALLERAVHDADGQLVSGSLMDYALPRAADLPSIRFASHPVPATTNPLGVKGCGEAGCTGAMPAIVNALIDALAEDGVTDIDMPATPEAVWRALAGGRY
jgi:carbon-monoxide dehydrogenase large subunit